MKKHINSAIKVVAYDGASIGYQEIKEEKRKPKPKPKTIETEQHRPPLLFTTVDAPFIGQIFGSSPPSSGPAITLFSLC
ncbi:hypothetical protein L6452_30541 [Arctium lappa]|uniref:Uncharacterized protein n=1 Tax=Arctium lappa TaxID=4217 RepID=A0ACB8ZMV3_ARCLA|nr:hypothetical protein L6452_30541 [Arctium lappa]